jgi:hypothetical protein
MTDFTDSLDNPDASRILLAEIKVYSGGSETTRYLGSHQLNTGSGDTPANKQYDSRLKGSPEFSVDMTDVFTGRTRVGFGDLLIDNSDGELDSWVDDAFDGRDITLKLGEPEWTISQFGTILSGTIEKLEVVDDSTLRLIIRDKQKLIDIPLNTNLIGGTDDYKDSPKPICYGEVFNILPVPIKTSTRKYQVHDGAINAFVAVYDNGITLTLGTAHANETALDGATVTAGQYDTCLSTGMFRLGSTPAGTVTADTKGEATTSYLSKPGEIIRDIITNLGPLTDPTDLDTTAFTNIDTDAPYTMGFYARDRRNMLDVIDEFVKSIGAFYGFDRSGKFTLAQFKDVSGTPVMTIDGNTELSGDLAVKQIIVPVHRVRLGYKKNWTIQLGDGLASAVTDAQRAFLETEYRTESDNDATVKTTHLLARDPDLNGTLITTSANASTEASRQLTLNKTQRIVYQINAFSAPFQLNLNDVVTLKDSRFGLESGVDCRVVGYRERYLDNQIELTLWK